MAADVLADLASPLAVSTGRMGRGVLVAKTGHGISFIAFSNLGFIVPKFLLAE